MAKPSTNSNVPPSKQAPKRKRSAKKKTSKRKTKTAARSKAKQTAPARRAPDDPDVLRGRACALTGLPLAAAALAAWEAAVAAAREQGYPCSLVLIDVDGFWDLNQQLGPALADRLLLALWERVEDVLSDQAFAGRLGGDVFGVALPGVEVEQAVALVDRVRAAVHETPYKLGAGAPRQLPPPTIRAGVAGLFRDGQTVDALVEQARTALWRAKSLGGNRVGLPVKERMTLKTSYYPQSQLEGLKALAARQDLKEATLLREALSDLQLKYKSKRPPEPTTD